MKTLIFAALALMCAALPVPGAHAADPRDAPLLVHAEAIRLAADGRAGVVVADFNGDGISLYLADGSGGLTKPADYGAGGGPTSGSYVPGTVVTLRAEAGAGYRFTGWEGAVDEPLSEETTLTVGADTTVSAGFERAE